MADPDAIHSFLSSYEHSSASSIPQQRPVCCCGNAACPFLKHNQSALEGLEKDVETAGRLGKALLMRHESYIADSERERKAMTAHIEMLEAEKQALEKRNATVIEENRNLLDQLEAVNSAVSESDAHVVNLQATLQSTQQELQKLSQLAARTESLERQLAEFEKEQEQWQASYEAKEEDEKSALRRWREAERTLAQLQDQIERIEREAGDEHERHQEVVERMERRHAVEKELGSAAGRLKGAAAAKNGSSQEEAPNVVSHFVKDILQDNANLQMGIVELREMLNNSNEEVETLRKQLQTHQPMDNDEKPTTTLAPREDLRQELNRANSSELHVHHHYHAPASAPKPAIARRPKKKRFGTYTSGSFTPSSGSSTPRSSFSYGTPTPTAAILQQTAASIPRPVPMRNRLSIQSNQTYQSLLASSGPSSPQSTTNRTSSIFDRVFSDAGLDSSRPTTPDTEDPGSPVFLPTHSKRGSQSSFRTHSAPTVSRHSTPRPTLDSILSIEEMPKLEELTVEPGPIPEEPEGEWENASEPKADVISNISPMSDEHPNPLHDQSFYRPRMLRGATSHESILSVSGLDVHTLKSRPSQLLAPYGGRGRGITSQAVIADTTAHASRPAAMSRPSVNTKNLLSGMAADQRQQSASVSKPGVGKKVGGWIFGRWGTTPAHYEEDATPTTTTKPAAKNSASVSSAADSIAPPKKSSVSSATGSIAPQKHSSVSTATNILTHQKNPSTSSSLPGSVAISKPKPTSVSSAPDNMMTKKSSSFSSTSVGSPDSEGTPRKFKVRSPGINQAGPIDGFFPEVRAVVREPVVRGLDEESLRKLLGGT